MQDLIYNTPLILDEIGAAIFCYCEDFELECMRKGIRDPWQHRPDTQNPKEIEAWKEERDNYIREREKYIALQLLDEYGWGPFEERCQKSIFSSDLKVLLEQMSPCMSKLNPQCSFFCKNYYNCIGDKDGQN